MSALADGGSARFRPLYPDAMSLWREDARHSARDLRRRRTWWRPTRCGEQLREFEANGFGRPADLRRQDAIFVHRRPGAFGAPTGHVLPVREVRLRAGAGFVVVIMGDIITMPGLPRRPAAERIHLVNGEIEGLF